MTLPFGNFPKIHLILGRGSLPLLKRFLFLLHLIWSTVWPNRMFSFASHKKTHFDPLLLHSCTLGIVWICIFKGAFKRCQKRSCDTFVGEKVTIWLLSSSVLPKLFDNLHSPNESLLFFEVKNINLNKNTACWNASRFLLNPSK